MQSARRARATRAQSPLRPRAAARTVKALDQYNHKFHSQYQKGLASFKHAYTASYGKEPTIGLREFLQILGGCEELSTPGAWFSWCDTFDIINAWRKVGITGNVLDPDQINRKDFVDRLDAAQAKAERRRQEEEADAASLAAAAPAAAPSTPERGAARSADDGEPSGAHASPTFSAFTATPAGMRSNTAPALRAKLELAKEYSGRQAAKLVRERDEHDAELAAVRKAVRFDPGELADQLGVLPVPAVELAAPKPDNTRLDSQNGSWSLREINTQKAAQTAQKEAEAARKAAAASERARKKAEAEAAAAELEASFDRCHQTCSCGVSPCPMAKARRCPTCQKIDLRGWLCKKAECSEARKQSAPAPAAPGTAASV